MPWAIASRHVLPRAQSPAWTAIAAMAGFTLAAAAIATIIVTVRMARADRTRDDAKRHEDREHDAEMRRQERERGDQLRREADETWERRRLAARSAWRESLVDWMQDLDSRAAVEDQRRVAALRRQYDDADRSHP